MNKKDHFEDVFQPVTCAGTEEVQETKSNTTQPDIR